MRDHDGRLTFKPRLPHPLERVAFRLGFRGRRLSVEVKRSQATYTLLAGDPLEIAHHDEDVTVTTASPLVRPIPPAPERETPSQPYGRDPRLGSVKR